ncbi:MAG: class I SAM-dependent methyltransferase [Gemmatimonadota bacterium]|nr:class I SAM-dependent methyltransferase [Gemmatimonadota bacterium]
MYTRDMIPTPRYRSGAPPARVPHDVWARHYDRVLERTFGRDYETFTERTLTEIRARCRPPARIVDFGAGTGRLAVPLARDGYRVTAVDPSPAMLAVLDEKRGGLPIECVAAGAETYRGAGEHDLALCVFSVFSYLLDERELRGAADAMAGAVRPGGLLLVSVPSRSVFESFDVETDDMIRCVEIEPEGDGSPFYRYRERTAVRGRGGEETYEDAFRLRAWLRAEVIEALRGAGCTLEEDLSAGFVRWGADYLLLRREDGSG